MKLDRDTVNKIREAITSLDTPDLRARYLASVTVDRNMDTAYRWSLFRAAGSWRLLPEDDSITDAHIDTALRHVVPSLYAK